MADWVARAANSRAQVPEAPEGAATFPEARAREVSAETLEAADPRPSVVPLAAELVEGSTPPEANSMAEALAASPLPLRGSLAASLGAPRAHRGSKGRTALSMVPGLGAAAAPVTSLGRAGLGAAAAFTALAPRAAALCLTGRRLGRGTRAPKGSWS